MGFILLLNNNKKWGISPSSFLKSLNENFGETELTEVKDLTRPYSFEFKINPTIEGFLHKEKDSIHLNGDFKTLCALAIILRKFIPLSERVLFFDDAYNNNIELSSDTTQIEIENAFSS